jgi:glycolate oxidase FAD binding subunit
MATLRPATVEELRDVVADAAGHDRPLTIRGGGSKAGLGHPPDVETELALDRLTGVVGYEPAELVLTAKAGTPLAEIEALLAEHRQMLAFEPPDWRSLLDNGDKIPTLGGTMACNLSGPRRIRAGAARDHFLGFSAVNGFGEIFKAGGKVVKNVTGYDLCKLMAGSYGTLSVLTEVTLKVLPRPDESMSILVAGLDDKEAIALLTDGLNSPHEVSAAAHLPVTAAVRSEVGVSSSGKPIAVLRLEGPASSIAFRLQALRELLSGRDQLSELGREDSERLWREISCVRPLLPMGEQMVWRLSLPPASAATAMAEISSTLNANGFYDWGGGLIWLAVAGREDAGAEEIRTVLAGHGGHATLIRAPEAIRKVVTVFEPLPGPLMDLSRRVKEGFDPKRLFNPGRLYQGM